MAHEIGSTDTIFSASSVTPWHGIGSVISSAPSVSEGIKLAGLDWNADVEPLFCEDGTRVPSQVVRRSTDKRVLGVVGPNWTALQNIEAFNWFQPFIDSGSASLETAGSLQNGKRVWVLAKLALEAQEIVKGDSICKYVMLSNGHDGKLSVRCGWTDIRIVCANTMQAAHSSEAGKLIRLRHHKGVKQALDVVRETMNLAAQEFQATAEQYRFLASRAIDDKTLVKYVKRVMGVDESATEVSTKTKNILEKVFENIFKGYGNDLPGVSGTWWAAYNGVNQYLNYENGRNANNRLNSLWFGQDGALDVKALQWATEYAQAV